MRRIDQTIVITLLTVTSLLGLGAFLGGCGRTPSRLGGEGLRQVLEVEGMQAFIGISFDRRGDSTVKDVTFLATDGYVYTQEFKDISPLEGRIRWVKHDEPESLIQSRAISRWTGSAVNLRMPEDCQKVLGVDVTYESDDERSKNLTCQATDGRILSREYREGLVDRHFAGWLEVRAAK